MNKLFLILLLLILFPVVVFAEGEDDWTKMYENDAQIQLPVPSVTDKEFNEACKVKMGKKRQKKNPYEDVRGNDMTLLNQLPDSYPTIMLTQKYYTDDGKVIEEGHYKVVVVIPKEKDGKYYVHFYQGHAHAGKMQMYETNEDYDEPEINYAKLIENNGETKFIYGNIDCNLECKMWEVK